MAVAVSGTPGSTTFAGASTGSFSLDVGSGSNRALGIGVTRYSTSDNISSVTYAGNAATLVDEIEEGGPDPGEISMYYQIAPSTGSNTLAVTFGSNASCALGGVGMEGVDQTTAIGTPAKAQGSSTSLAVTVGTAAGDMVFAATLSFTVSPTLSPANGETEQWESSPNDDTKGAGYTVAASGSSFGVSITASSTVAWGIVGVAFKAAGGGAARPNALTLLGVG